MNRASVAWLPPAAQHPATIDEKAVNLALSVCPVKMDPKELVFPVHDVCGKATPSGTFAHRLKLGFLHPSQNIERNFK